MLLLLAQAGMSDEEEDDDEHEHEQNHGTMTVGSAGLKFTFGLHDDGSDDDGSGSGNEGDADDEDARDADEDDGEADEDEDEDNGSGYDGFDEDYDSHFASHFGPSVAGARRVVSAGTQRGSSARRRGYSDVVRPTQNAPAASAASADRAEDDYSDQGSPYMSAQRKQRGMRQVGHTHRRGRSSGASPQGNWSSQSNSPRVRRESGNLRRGRAVGDDNVTDDDDIISPPLTFLGGRSHGSSAGSCKHPTLHT